MANDRPWSKFFWSDWESDERLRQCSLAAQGLWMRMLCICAKGEPTGYLSIAGQPLDAAGVARSVGASTDEVETLMAELEAWGVFSRDRKRRIYSRRMVKDVKKSQEGRKHKLRGIEQPFEKPEKKPGPSRGASRGPSPHKPEAREVEKDGPDGPSKKKVAAGSRLPDDWWPSEAEWQFAQGEGMSDEEIRREAHQFCDYWRSVPGQRGRKVDWAATWRNRIRDVASRGKRASAGKPSQGHRQGPGSVVGAFGDLMSGRSH